jgi:hypothetical protein
VIVHAETTSGASDSGFIDGAFFVDCGRIVIPDDQPPEVDDT